MYDGESAQEKISENSPPKNKNLNKTSFDVFLVLFWYVLVFIENHMFFILPISFFPVCIKHSSHRATFTRINRKSLVCRGFPSYMPEMK